MPRSRNRDRKSGKLTPTHTKGAVWRTLGLIAIFGVIFVIQLVVGIEESIFRAGLVKPLTKEGEIWRMLTAAFMHGSARHLFMNLTAAFLFGLMIELYGGQWLILPLFIASAIGGNIASLYMLANTSVGASGGILGFVGFLSAMFFRRRDSLPPDFGIGLAKAIFPTAIIGLLAWQQIDNAAHAGGFITGALIGFACFLPSAGRIPLQPSTFGVAADRVGQLAVLGSASCTIIFLLK